MPQIHFNELGRAFVVTTLLAVVWAAGCSTLQPPDPNGPRSTAPAYPVVFTDEVANQEGALIAWRQLAPLYSGSDQTEVNLDPLTATIRALPTNLKNPILLPKVGAEPVQSEEETRESLRRFIDDWRVLIGAEPSHLSLIERTDEPSGIKLARYEQRPFRYALRGGYGKLLIRFNSNRQLVELSSTCLRNADRLQTALSAITPKVSAEEAVAHIRGKTVNVPDSNGQTRSFTLSANETAEAKQLVVYALPSSDRSTLELHVAWEIETPNAPAKKVYLDVVSDQIIAAE
jgi:hypothetical protein